MLSRSLTVFGLAFVGLPQASVGFSSTLFQSAPTLQKTATSRKEGVDIELPDFDELFDRIQQVSPLARAVIHRATVGEKKGFQAADDTCKLCT